MGESLGWAHNWEVGGAQGIGEVHRIKGTPLDSTVIILVHNDYTSKACYLFVLAYSLKVLKIVCP